MAYWTVAGDPRNDAAKAREWRKHLAKTDWVAEMKRIEGEAAKVKATQTGRRAERLLELLRRDWKSAAHYRDFVRTGVGRA